LLLTILLASVAAFLGLSLIAVAVARGSWATALIYGAAVLISIACLAAALTALATSSFSVASLPLGLPWIGAHFRLDGLSAFFIAVIDLSGAAASLYAIGYGRHEASPSRVLPFVPAFLGSMNLVLLADDAFSFLVSWELMSVTSWALVVAHHKSEANRRAGYIYIVMASFGTLALLLAFGLLAGPDGGYSFVAMRGSDHSPLIAGLVLLLLILGAGSKAGLFPLHVWLPLAHPAAPSHVSGLMSGAMTKVAVYGFIRIFFDLLHVPSWWSSVIVLVLGGATAVMGVLYALMQHELKRLLAYHTVENIGIIFIGIGLAMAFQANRMEAAAALAMTAALFHVLNHSLFKSILFFGAGAVINSTGTGDFERLGGLIHRMPLTSFAFLVGSVAISALPPFNGFVSEWLTFQAILISPTLPQWALKLAVPAVGAMLALSAALAAGCFVKAFGITFLGRARSAAAEAATEVDRWSISAMLFLGLLCTFLGVLPGLLIDLLAPTVAALTGLAMPRQAHLPWRSIIPIAQSRSSYNGLLIFAFLTCSALAASILIHRFASRAHRRAPPWACGTPQLDPSMQYSATSFAQPIRRVFGTTVFRASETVEPRGSWDKRPARIVVQLSDPAWTLLFGRIAAAVDSVAGLLNKLQFLTIRRYLMLVFCSLVILLIGLAVWS
jgi:hydrogenase-4 component B